MTPPPMGRAFYASDRPRVGGLLRTKDERPETRGVYLRSLRYAVGLMWSVRPAYVVLNLLNILWNVPSRILNIWIVQFVVNTAIGAKDLGAVAFACAGYLTFMLVRDGAQSFLVRDYNVAAEDRIRSDIQLRLHDQARSSDLAAFDSKAFYDDYARALDVLDERVIKCFKDLVSVLGSAASIVTVGGVMVSMSPALVVVVFIGCLGTVVAYTRRSRIAVLRNHAITPLMRRFQYLNDLYYQRCYAKDMRAERIDDIVWADHRLCTEELDAEDRKWGRRSAGLTLAGNAVGSFTDVAMYFYLAWCVVVGTLDAGGFIALANASWQFSANLQTLFRGLPELGETCLLIADAQGFGLYESRLAEPDADSAAPVGDENGCVESLVMRSVGFSYEPGKPILNDVTFEARRGHTLAIVGHNGAGKSTVAKLLLRLYDPDEGEVLLDGLLYAAYVKADLRAAVAVVHQDYQHYAYSVAENVLMRPVGDGDDRERVCRALAQVGLLSKVEGFEDGIDAHVTKEFSESGELFSGGELQRLAIARALAKDAPIVVLDEPSSALDPLVEREIIDLMEELFVDRICVVISHRLSMTRDADCILVMDGGRIVERGTHNELKSAGGLYASMWEAQAGKYS